MSQKNIAKILDPHIQFVREVVNRYKWTSGVKRELGRDMASLQHRIDDDCVTISIVGEFSSGKSSVINAMLGVNLLAMDDLPDTTLVPSVITFSESPTLEVLYNDGRRSYEQLSIEQIRDYILQYSFRDSLLSKDKCDELCMEKMIQLREDIANKAAEIERFYIGIPSAFLKKGFRIVDTPGLNSLNANCTRVTHGVLANSDSSIIVGMATDGGLHQKFREKLAEIIGNRIEQCSVVFTHYDHIPPEKREQSLTYLQAVTASYFNLSPDRLMVVPMVPPTILASLDGRTFGMEHDKMLHVTCLSMTKVLDYAVKQRETTILKSLQKILAQILSNLQVRISEIKTSYEKRLKKLEKSSITPLDSFIDAQLVASLKVIEAESLAYRVSINNDLNAIIQNTKSSLERRILAQSDLEGVQKYMKNVLPDVLEDSSRKMNQSAADGRLFLSRIIGERLRLFEESLIKEFKRLRIVHIPLKEDSTEICVIDTQLIDTMKNAVQFADSEFDREQTAGAFEVVGAIIGSIFVFGIGTAIGALIGGLLGARGRSTSVEAVFKRLKPKYEEKLDSAFSLQRDQVLAAYDTSVREYMYNFEGQLSNYQNRYKSEIDNMIVEEYSKRKEIVKIVKQINNDLEEISRHQNGLKEYGKSIGIFY